MKLKNSFSFLHIRAGGYLRRTICRVLAKWSIGLYAFGRTCQINLGCFTSMRTDPAEVLSRGLRTSQFVIDSIPGLKHPTARPRSQHRHHRASEGIRAYICRAYLNSNEQSHVQGHHIDCKTGGPKQVHTWPR